MHTSALVSLAVAFRTAFASPAETVSNAAFDFLCPMLLSRQELNRTRVNSLLSPQKPTENSQTLLMAYYPDWLGPSLPPERIDCARFHWIDFAFALPKKSSHLDWDSPDAPDLLRRLVLHCHATNTKVKASIGGWTGSAYFSSAVSTALGRMTLVSDILGLYLQYNLDGIDIDWEYPGQEGNSGNRVNKQDSENFLAFLKLLRDTLPASARITAAVQSVPFAGPDGKPLKDAFRFAQVLDWILVMNYDVWGYSDAPGPNAPMYDGCNNSTQPDANVVSAFNAWTSAGFQPSQLVLGLPSYGYVADSDADTLRTRSIAPNDMRTSRSVLRGVVKLVADEDHQIQFKDLISQGALIPQVPEPTGQPADFNPAGGFIRRWDQCSSTPYLVSHQTKQVVAYDDPQSIYMKASLSRKLGMLGVNIFDVGGDTQNGDLVNAMKSGLEL